MGKAAPSSRDSPFLRKALSRSVFQTAAEFPSPETVALIHRLDNQSGELAWMPDGHNFCYALVRRGISSSVCGSLPDKPPAPGLLFVRLDDSDRGTEQGKEGQTRLVSFVIVEGGSRRFDHVVRAPGAGPVHQAVLRFPSGRMVTLLTFDRPWGPLDQQAEICSTDRKVCFPSHP